MRVVVLGAGAVGTLLGARFAAAGDEVVLVGRPPLVAAAARGPIEVEGVAPLSVRVPAAPELPVDGAPDAVVVAVKTYDLEGALMSLGRRLRPAPTLLTENGLGIAAVGEAVLRRAGWARADEVLVRAVHSVPATALAPGRVRAAGIGEVVLPDPARAGPAAAAVLRFRDLFARAGLPVRLAAAIGREEWKKAIVNAAVNPVTALHGVPNGALAEGPARAEALALLGEAVEVAHADGIAIDLAEARTEFDRVVAATRDNRSSMRQDLEHGRPTEIEAISGEILRRGIARGLSLPATEAAVRAVEARVRAARAPQR